MNSPKVVRNRSVLTEPDSYTPTTTRRNWEGLLTALGISALGWATIALLIMRLLR
jgi:hypothetical protein